MSEYAHERRGEFLREGHRERDGEGPIDWGSWSWTAQLDEPTDCETCGWSADDVGVTTEDFERFEVTCSVGCLGGSHAEGDLDTVVKHLLDEWGHLAYTKDVTKALRAAVAEAKESA